MALSLSNSMSVLYQPEERDSEYIRIIRLRTFYRMMVGGYLWEG